MSNSKTPLDNTPSNAVVPLFTRGHIRRIVFDQFLTAEKMDKYGNDAMFLARQDYQRRLELAGLPLDNYLRDSVNSILDDHIAECKSKYAIDANDLSDASVQDLNDKAADVNACILQDIYNAGDGLEIDVNHDLFAKLNQLTAMVEALADGVQGLCEGDFDRIEELYMFSSAVLEKSKDGVDYVEKLISLNLFDVDGFKTLGLKLGQLASVISVVTKGLDLRKSDWNVASICRKRIQKTCAMADVALEFAKKYEAYGKALRPSC